MDLEEAKRRTERALVEAGYSMSGAWMDETPLDGLKQPIGKPVYSMALQGPRHLPLPGFRVVLWPYKSAWEAVVALTVGKRGQFPLTGGRFARYMPLELTPYEETLPRLTEVAHAVERWNTLYLPAFTYEAVAQLAIVMLDRGDQAKARQMLLRVANGELSRASIGEALEMTQELWFTKREDRLLAALVWWRVMEGQDAY